MQSQQSVSLPQRPSAPQPMPQSVQQPSPVNTYTVNQRPTLQRPVMQPQQLRPPQPRQPQMAVQSIQLTQNRVSRVGQRAYRPQQIPQQRYAMQQPQPYEVHNVNQRPTLRPQRPKHQLPLQHFVLQPQRRSAPQQRPHFAQRQYPTQSVTRRRTVQQNEPKPSVLPTLPQGISLTPNSTKSTPMNEQPRPTRPPITRMQPKPQQRQSQSPTPIKPMSMPKPLQRMDAQAMARARSQRIKALLHSRKPVRQQTEAQRPQSVSEISSVSAVSSSPSVSNRFASADTSSKAPSDDTVISARSSLSDDSNQNSVSRSGIYDFRLKRERNANANAQSGIVARQLNAMS